MERKGNTKFLVLVIAIILLLLVPALVALFPNVNESIEPLKTSEIVLANTTEDTATLSLGTEADKIGKLWTFEKDNQLDLDIFCAQEGGSASSWVTYQYNKVEWNENAGVWKSQEAYKKFSWIKDNFLETSNVSDNKRYTSNEKLAMLNVVDSSITIEEVKNVFENKNEKFKLYQMLIWSYTNGKDVNVGNYINGSNLKIYNAINKLANKFYNQQPVISINAASEAVWNSSNKTYTWEVSVNSTYPLPYNKANNGNTSLVLVVDENNNYTNYEYDGKTLIIKGLEDAEHTFKVSAYSYTRSSKLNIWVNQYHQNMMEIIDSNKVPHPVNAQVTTAKTINDGKFNLNVLKIDENNNPVEDVVFKLGETEYETNSNGIASLISNEVLTEAGRKYEYSISEVETLTKYLKLENPISIVLTSGLRTSADGTTYISIIDAYFKDNNSRLIDVETENDRTTTLKLELVYNSDTTTIRLVVPNKEKIYDLALTKTIVVPVVDSIDKYDINRDGIIDSRDSTCFLQLSSHLTDSNATIIDFLENTSVVELQVAYEKYYRYYTEQELKDMLAKDRQEALNKANNALRLYAESSLNKEQDRIHNVLYSSILNIGGNTTAEYNMNKIPYEVEVTDEITYKITVYNEGDYDSKNITITDYLPEGLKICNVAAGVSTVERGEKQYVWTVDETNNTATITISDILKAYNGSKLDSIDVYITCEIDEEALEAGDINYDDVLYNVAEITTSEPIDSEGNVVPGVIDRDSNEDSIIMSTQNDVIDNYTEKFENVEADGNNAGYISKSKYDYEDDDDFERIIIKKDLAGLDLSLRKSITKIGADEKTMTKVTSQYTYQEEGKEDSNKIGDRLPVITEASSIECMENGTGLYFHPKEAVLVRSGDYVEYTIRVYNEGRIGDYAGYASQITDYLPQGLQFVGVVNNDGRWITTTENGMYKTTVDDYYGGYELSYDSANNKVVIDYVGSLALRIKKGLRDIYEFYDKGIQTFGYYNSEEDNAEKYIYQEIKLICKVVDITDSQKLTNVAEITGYIAVDEDGAVVENITDRDSSPNVTISETTNMDNNQVNLDTYYNDRKVDDVYNQYYPGCEDDDDFETIIVKVINGKYTLKIRKLDSISNEPINGATFKVNGETTKPTENGVVDVLDREYNNTNIKEVDTYTISEVNINSDTEYIKLKEPVTIYVKKSLVKVDEGGSEIEVCKVTEVSFDQNSIVNEKEFRLEDDTKVKVILSLNENVIEVIIPNKPTGFDLALRKFILKVNGEELKDDNSREPKVDTSSLLAGKTTTAEYIHPKNAVLVSPKDIVQYTLRIYNEGTLDGYAKTIMDDVPEGVKVVAPAYDKDGKPTNINAQYGWVMYKEYASEGSSESSTNVDIIRYNEKMYIRTDKAEEAVLIVTNYLSKENGEAMMSAEDKVNPNLISAYNKKDDVLSYKDIQIEFEVKPSNKEDKEITNYAQITDDSDANGNPVIDRDSTPNEWEESPRDDDQDIEKIKVKYFDLALYKWVNTTIVMENGTVKQYETEHTQDDKSKLVNVTIPKDNLNKTVVKFKYTIKVENQGNLAGYAKELKDHIPQGLKFVAEDNIKYGWILEEDGTITTDYLKDTLLQPGETAEVEVVLTWINGENNLGEKMNFAEISGDYNDYGAPDIDSTPDNFEDEVKEDDEDKDVVMLNVRTGSATIIYAVIGITVMTIITAGVVGIKKFVL